MRATVRAAGLLAFLLVALGCKGGPAAALPATTTGPAAPGDVAAVVNGQAIPMALYQAQLKSALASFPPQPGLDPQSPEVQAALRMQVLDMLIDQALTEQAAARMGIRVDEAQVAAEVERIRGQAAGDLAGWLEANGYTEETLAAQVRSELVGAAVRDRVTSGVPAGPDEVSQRQEAFMRWLDGERQKAKIERLIE